ncbi:MAG TPA: NADPH:quinone oxidoreductase family protein [Steroidobacteraceae bacterium]|nr:NADPH:quinone oxidoreductase family protein [Steroidobacteraceae bacterium]
MKALVCHTLTGPQDLKLELQWPEPKAGPGEVLVDVKAAALNFPDVLMTRGLYQERPPLPFVPGLEFAGVVAEVGEGVTRVQPGDRVVAYSGQAVAEKVAVRQEFVMPMPRTLDFVAASGVCLTYFTSYHALKQRAQLQPGETLLVLGAGGGVGTTAVELGKVMGARVIAAASTDEKLEVARSLGADHLVNYSTEDVRERLKQITGGAGVDVVYDPVGGVLTEAAVRSLAWKGRFLVIGFAAGEIPKLAINLLLLKGASLVGVFWGAFARREPQVQRQNVRELWELFEAGTLKPVVGQVYALENGASAFAALEGRQAKGKVVIRVGG